MSAPPLLDVRDLEVVYPSPAGPLPAVRGVSFAVHRGEAVGIVGESGCGKSTVLKALLGLVDAPGRRTAGTVAFEGRDVGALSHADLRALRRHRIGTVFQDPVNVLNPALTVRHQLRRAVRLRHEGAPPADIDAAVLGMLGRVGIDGRGKLDSYPFQFSQGQLQRIAIAMACLAGSPSLVLADEPTTSLDVTIEAQIVRLLRDLRRELDLALVLVTHNLALVAQLCDRILVMYAGRLVEEADVTTLFDRPAHPYTRQLLRSIPPFPSEGERLYAMRGDVPDLHGVRTGCPFAPRCDDHLGAVCDDAVPALTPAGAAGQRAACHLYPGSVEPGSVEGRGAGPTDVAGASRS